MTLCTSHISVLLEANPRVASMPSNLCSVSSICVLTLRLRMSVFMLARSLTNRPSQPQSHDPVVCDHAAPVPLPVLIPACDGRIPRYVGTAALPHLPFSCIVIGSSPHLHNGRAPVILNVCPETLQEPDASLAISHGQCHWIYSSVQRCAGGATAMAGPPSSHVTNVP